MGLILFSQLFSHRDFDTPRNLIYMSYLCWYDAKFIKKSGSFQNRCVFPLFSRNEKSATRISSKLLIFKVDQLGLEPRTSRLWVCCSNQLSYKSNALHDDVRAVIWCKGMKKWRDDQISMRFFWFPLVESPENAGCPVIPWKWMHRTVDMNLPTEKGKCNGN